MASIFNLTRLKVNGEVAKLVVARGVNRLFKQIQALQLQLRTAQLKDDADSI
jgi:hypothetical protein